MGVPQLFPWIADNFRGNLVRHRGRKGYPTFKISSNYLYFDGNASLHPVCQRVFAYGDDPTRNIPGPYPNLSYEEKIRKAFELWVEGLVYVTKMVDSEVIYIAIDGPAPLAKQAQQRERRFVAKPSTSGFDSNSITPGTPFMFELTKYMNFAIRRLAANEWKGKTIYFSPGNEPGEGEHKIVDFIRRLPKSHREDKTHVIVGPDADLIMLTLVSRCRHIFLLREDTSKKKNEKPLFAIAETPKEDTGSATDPTVKDPTVKDLQTDPTVKDQFVIDMSGVASDLPEVLTTTDSVPQAVNDFVLLGFFLGNDFVPRIRMFLSLRRGINHLISIIRNKKLKLTNRGSIDWTGFGSLIEELARAEARLLAEQANDPSNGRDPDRPPVDPELINHTLLAHITDSARGPILDYDGYRKDYYARAGVALEDVPKMCNDYLASLEWILVYYTKGLSSWEHFYPHHYAPLMRDLQRSLSRGVPVGNLHKGRPSLPFEQLLTVLPPHSSKLLPMEYRRLFFASELTETYPETVEYDYEGVGVRHLHKVLIPFADIKLIRRVYASVSAKTEYARNREGRTSVFRYEPTAVPVRYVSDYGTLRFCRVVKSTTEATT